MKYTMAPGEEDPDDEGASISENAWTMGDKTDMSIDTTFNGVSNTWSSDYTRAQWNSAHYRAALAKQQESNTLVIGIGGLLRSGKDTVADYLVKEHDFVKLGMSDALADALYVLNPVIWYRSDAVHYQWIVNKLGYVVAKTVPEVRRLLQVLGTEVGRNMISPTVWVDITQARINALTAAGKRVVITGIRYQNELDMIHALSGVAWWVDRPEVNTGSTHSSETSVTGDDFDAVIENTCSISTVYKITEDWLDALIGKDTK